MSFWLIFFFYCLFLISFVGAHCLHLYIYFLEDPDKQLLNACKNGTIRRVKRLLKKPNINPNYENRHGFTPFYLACSEGYIEIVKLLLNDSRIFFNKQSNDGQTPFYIACKQERIDVVKLLLNDERIDVNSSGHLRCVTPFFVACQKGSIEVVQLLLDNERVDVNKALENGITPISIACVNHHIEVVKLFINNQRIDVNKANKLGQAPLFIVCKNGDIEILKLLLKDKRLDTSKSKMSQTPCHIACNQGRIEVLKYLLVYVSEVTLATKDKRGRTLIDIARKCEKKFNWESEEDYQERKRNSEKMRELLESFERNRNKTKLELRIQLDEAGTNFSLQLFSFNINQIFFAKYLKQNKMKDAIAAVCYATIVLLCDNYLKFQA